MTTLKLKKRHSGVVLGLLVEAIWRIARDADALADKLDYLVEKQTPDEAEYRRRALEESDLAIAARDLAAALREAE